MSDMVKSVRFMPNAKSCSASPDMTGIDRLKPVFAIASSIGKGISPPAIEMAISVPSPA